jgi:hypothetical protein
MRAVSAESSGFQSGAENHPSRREKQRARGNSSPPLSATGIPYIADQAMCRFAEIAYLASLALNKAQTHSEKLMLHLHRCSAAN